MEAGSLEHFVPIWTRLGDPKGRGERDQGPDQELGRGSGHQDRREGGEDHHRVPEEGIRRGDALVRPARPPARPRGRIPAATFPTFPASRSFIGEESVANGQACVLTDKPTWIIDPVDGTTNFVHG